MYLSQLRINKLNTNKSEDVMQLSLQQTKLISGGRGPRRYEVDTPEGEISFSSYQDFSDSQLLAVGIEAARFGSGEINSTVVHNNVTEILDLRDSLVQVD